MKTFLKLGVFLVSLVAFASINAKVYQYWFDKGSPTQSYVVPSPFEFEADVSSLSPGGHVLKYRLQDDEQRWGAPFNEYFYIPVQSRPILPIAGAEYWIDGNSVARVGVNADNSRDFDIDITALAPGGHMLSYRLRDTGNSWGSQVNMPFYVPLPSMPTSDVKKKYQYWLDNDLTTVIEDAYTDGSNSFDIDLSGLSEGGHIVSYRLLGGNDNWGSTLIKPFYIPVSYVPTSDKKKKYQYWLDNDRDAIMEGAYSEESKSFDIDIDGLSEGGHLLSYRLLGGNDNWGAVMEKPFYVPVTPDESSTKAIACRVIRNNDILSANPIPLEEGTESLELEEAIPDDILLSYVTKRTFSHVEDEMKMQAEGYYTYAVQLLSDKQEWGAPYNIETPLTVTSKAIPQVIEVPGDFYSLKADNNHFLAVKFNAYRHSIYIKPSQDCRIEFYSLTGSETLSHIKSLQLLRGETTLVETLNRYEDVVAVIYDTKIDKGNPDSDILVQFMYEDNKVPQPQISFDPDTWDVTITCADKRATIFYTLNGEKPDTNSDVYEQPIHLEKVSTVRAYAVLEGMADSDEVIKNIEEVKLPKPRIEHAGGNLFKLTNIVEGVTTYYTLDGTSPESEETRLTYDGNPFTVESSCRVRAYCVKTNVLDSEKIDQMIYVSDYVTPSPYRNEYDDTRMNIQVPEGTAYYRFFLGKDESVAGEWTEYDGGDIAITGNMTVQVYAESPGKERSAVVAYYTDWVPADKPKFEYDEYKLKLKTSTPGGKIYYYLYDQTESDATEYSETDTPDGIDVAKTYCIYAFVIAEGYTKSGELVFYPNSFDLLQPTVAFDSETGYIDLSYDDEAVKIYVTVTPEQDVEVVSSNHVRVLPEYNSKLTAYAKKSGYNSSKEIEVIPATKPTILVEEYKVTINNNSSDSGEIYYTTDGSKPTRASALYDGEFISEAGTIRAVLFVDEKIPAEAEAAKVMDQVATPAIALANEFGKLSTATPGATIYYSTDISINNSTRKVYDASANPDGINLKSVNILYAYAEAEDYRRSETLVFYKNEYVLDRPSISYSNGYVTAQHGDESVGITFTDESGSQYHADADNPRRAKVPYNATVKAYAHKNGYINSDIVTIEPTQAPKVTADLFTISIESKSGQTVRYTTDGTMPTESSAIYTSPFKVDQTCDVRAVAFGGNDVIPSEATILHIDYKKAKSPSASSYDGRYLTLTAEAGSAIFYSIGGDDSKIIEQGIELTGNKIDVEGLNEIKAIAKRGDADDSEVLTYEVKYYANETDAYFSEPGHAQDAFKWCSDLSVIESFNVHGSMSDDAGSNGNDYEVLMALPELKHLDLSEVTASALPDRALASGKLISVVLPTSLKTVGENLFGSDNSTLCSIELSGNEFAPANLLDGIKNPNILLYAKSKTQVSKLETSDASIGHNVIVLGGVNGTNRAEDVALTHAYPFYVPQAFTSQKISYTRAFTKETQIGELGAGWETMIVPFDVQTVMAGDRIMKPFGDVNQDASERPFWLFRGGETNWERVISMEANIPYLIAFPNHSLYADEYNVNGDVVFSSNNAYIVETPEEDAMVAGFGGGKYIVGNYATVAKADNIYALNEEDYYYNNLTFKPGGIFVSGQRDVPAFECYVTSPSALSAMPVFDASEVESLLSDSGIQIWSEGHDIYVRSAIGMKLRIFDTVGQLVRVIDVKAGETACAENFTPGIYLVGTTKLLVK